MRKYRRAPALVGLSLALAGCCGGSRSDGSGTAPAATFQEPSPPSAAVPSPPAVPTRPACLTASGVWQGTQDKDPGAKRYEAELRSWTPECRRAAFEEECLYRCSEVVSDHIIAAGATKEERRALLELRASRNETSVVKGRLMYERVNEIVKYAVGLRSSPRDMARGCVQRMVPDHNRIKALRDGDLQAALRELPEGAIGYKSILSYAISCVDCGDDRSLCDEMVSEMKDQADNIRETDKLAKADRRALARIDASTPKKSPGVVKCCDALATAASGASAPEDAWYRAGASLCLASDGSAAPETIKKSVQAALKTATVPLDCL